MDQRQRRAQQRVMAQEALGTLRAVAELFGTEDNAVPSVSGDLDAWQAKIAELEAWIFDESPIA